MRVLNIFSYEWKHFFRNRFKVIAVVLFIVASVYGLHNGAYLYEKQNSEIEKLSEKANEEKEEIIAYFEDGKKGPEGKPWINITKPFWAIWKTTTYKYKKPSPLIVYNIGQTEQYGFYKKISTSSSPYDSDMAKEIANPERIQSGTLDFSFVVLYLLPLLLLVLVYNIKGAEAEQGFLSLVFVQTGLKNWWILSRTTFYIILVLFVLFGLLLYGGLLTGVFDGSTVFWSIFLWIGLYLLFWSVIYFLILKYGKNTISNTLQMLGIWLLFAFIIPAGIQQWISIEKPTNLMIDLIDAKRDKTDKIYEQSNAEIDKQLFSLYPSIEKTEIAGDSILIKRARRNSMEALINLAMKDAIAIIEKDSQAKNEIITNSYWFNPIIYFQNKLNHLSKTHFNNYQAYRNDIQELVDNRIETMVLDIWSDIEVDKEKYLEYHKKFNE